MFTRILVPLDGSATAEKALPQALALARTLDIPITLITVIERAPEFSIKKARYLDTLIDSAVRNSEQYLGELAKKFSGVAIEYTVARGRAEDMIVTNAAAKRGTLIALATHGRSGLDRWLLGSVAAKVLHLTDNPVLVVRASEKASPAHEAVPESIIVPLDGSASAEFVLAYVVALATVSRSRITLLRSYSLKQIIFSFAEFHPDVDEIKGQLRWEAESYLKEKAAELKVRGLADVFCRVSEGDAAETIIELGKEAPNALIAITAHGGSTIKHWFLGSVAEKVLRHAHNSVLTIPVRDIDEASGGQP